MPSGVSDRQHASTRTCGGLHSAGGGLRHPDSCPALVLNADYRPLSYYPLSICCWQEALKNVFLERVNIVQEYEEVVRDALARLPHPRRRLA